MMKTVELSATLINSTLETLAAIRVKMDKLASTLPEYKTVMSLYGVGRVMCSQLIAEIDDVRRFEHSKSLVAMAGIDPPPNQSGQVDVKSRSISKRGSPLLRKTLFQIMLVILQNKPINEPVYQFLDRKRSEGKPYRVYMIAASHKFLRIYYARVMEALG
ncbi:MAG: IS110 family transposase [Ruminiclostridium sp.]|nr:IS110 family transposase [Ruminiclostridium sp.]